jgi:hypothetical protein
MDRVASAKVDWKRSYYAEADQSDALRKECDALRKDAERYRWLRDEAPAFVVRPFADKPGSEWDALIDAEMLARGAVGAA